MTPKNEQFHDLMLDVIDECLSILGDQPRQAVYHYLMTMHSVDREEIPDKLEDFTAGLRRALGGASAVIQRLILKKLYQRIGSTFHESQGLEFLDYVSEARRRFETARQRNLGDAMTDIGKSKKGQVSG